MKKKIVLALAFLLPVLGILVFNFFSSSHFEIKTYYLQDVPRYQNCPAVTVPYHVSDSIQFVNSRNTLVQPLRDEKIKIFSIGGSSDFFISELNRVSDAFIETDTVPVYLLDSLVRVFNVPMSETINQIYPNDASIPDLVRCHFLFDPEKNDNALLIDEQNRIRGYYDLMKREETDSLIIETKILLREKDFN